MQSLRATVRSTHPWLTMDTTGSTALSPGSSPQDSELLLIDAYHVAAQAALGDERAVSSDVAGTLEELARWKPLRKERVPDRSDVFVRESGSRFEVAPENIEARHLGWGSRIPAGRAVQKAIFTAN